MKYSYRDPDYDERKLVRNINILAAAFAVFMVAMAILALRATF